MIRGHSNVAIHCAPMIINRTAELYLSELGRATIDDLVTDTGVLGDISVGPENSNDILLQVLEFFWFCTIIALANRNDAIMIDLKTKQRNWLCL